MISKIIFIALYLFFLLREYSKTKGFIKAKFWHFITVLVITSITLDSPNKLNLLIGHHNLEVERLTSGLDGFDKQLSILNQYYSSILGIVLLFFTAGVLIRNNPSRVIFIYLNILMIPSAASYIYLGAKSSGGNYSITYFVIALIFSTLFFGFISMIYNKKLMIDFFNEKKANAY